MKAAGSKVMATNPKQKEGSTMKKMMTLMTVFGLVLALAPGAWAELVVYEGYDMSASDGDPLTSLSGATSIGFDNAWAGDSGSGATYGSAGLSIGSGSTVLQTVGGHLNFAASGTQWIERGYSATITGTIYGSYLFKRNTSLSSANDVAAVYSNPRGGKNDGNTQWWFASDDYNTANGSIRGGGTTFLTGTRLTDGNTYIVLFTLTNVGLAGNNVAEMWILSSAQFDSWKGGSLDLATASTGTGVTDVWQKGTRTYTGAIMPNTDSLHILVYQDTCEMDEIRISTTSLAEATPIIILPPAGTLFIFR